MRHLFFALCITLTLITPQLRAADKPNVIIIYTDDQGYADAHCCGSEELTTPGIDVLATTGVRFTQFEASAPVCSPSRAGLLTGRYPIRAGMPNNAGAPPIGDINDKAHAGLTPELTTIAEMLRAHGYATAHIGKWHLGHGEGSRPTDQGFDYSFGHLGGCIDNYSHFNYWNGPNRHDLWENETKVFYPGEFFPDLMVEKASAFIDKNRDKPFFMYFAMNAPHYPYQATPDWLEHYKDLDYPRNLYAAFVSTLDVRIAALVKHLEDTGLRKTTIIIYQSDHGYSCEPRAHGGGGSAGDLRGAKFSLFEGGMRVPAVISWPGHLPQGEVRKQFVHGCDWMPTIAQLVGVDPPADIDGRSIVSVIKSAAAPSPHDVVHWTIGKAWAVRQGDWKLMHGTWDPSNKAKMSDADKKAFLSNVIEDPTEMTNLADKHPDIVQRLQKLHDDWAQTLKDE
jgi:arylsulfatase A-like enzyme